MIKIAYYIRNWYFW